MIHRLRVPSLVAAALLFGAPALAAPPPSREKTPVDEVVNGVTLLPHQETAVARIKQDEEAAKPPLQDATKSFDDALAAEVRKGSVDPSSKELKSKVDSLANAAEKWSDTESSAFDRLHGILDRTQRAEVAPRVATHARDLDDLKPDMPRLARSLHLTATQRREVDKVIREDSKVTPPAAGATKAKIPTREVSDSFKKESGFTMEKFMPPSDTRARTVDAADKQIDMTKKIVLVLTPEQRDKLADEIAGKGSFTHEAIMTKAPTRSGP